MLYEKYQGSLRRIASVIKFIKRFSLLFIIGTAAIIIGTSTCLAIKGIIYDVKDCPTSIAYGEELSYEANAIFADVTYEYAPKGTDDWTTESPKTVGEYDVRAVSTRTFGGKSYGKTYSFAIEPKVVDVYVNQEKIEYGKTPTVTADLVKGDVIACDKMEYFDLENKEKSRVIPVKESIVIKNSEGEEVTSSYSLQPVERDITFTLRQVEVTIDGKEVIYNGTPYGSEDYSLTEGTLAFDDQLSLAFDKTITDVGTEQNTAKITVLSADNQDVTHQYYILIKCGDLVVNKRPVTVVTGSKTHLYDGTEISEYSYTIKESEEDDYGLVKGHTLVRNEAVVCTATNAGTVQNVLEYAIHDQNGKDVTGNYEVTYEYGSITVAPRPIKYVTSTSTHTYDGTWYSDGNFTYADDTEYTLIDGHTAVASTLPQVKYVEGNPTKNEFSIIINSGEEDVTGNYVITYDYGTIAILPRAITLTTDDRSKTYDDTPLTGESYTITDTLTGEVVSLIEGDEAKVHYVGEITDVGSIENCAVVVDCIKNAASDVTDCYTITCKDGTLTVTPREITVTTGSSEKTYDGEALFNTTNMSADDLVAGHTLFYYEEKGRTEITDVLRDSNDATVILGVDNVHEVLVKTKDGEEDKTRNYTIKYEYGTLRVLPREIIVTTGSKEFTYNGEIHFHTDDAIAENLVTGHTVKYDGGSKTKVMDVIRDPNDREVILGVNNVYEVLVYDGVADKTNNYDITYEYGKLIVWPRVIKVTTATDRFTYDGEVHSNTTLANTENLVAGHEAVYDGQGATKVVDVLRSDTDDTVILGTSNEFKVIVQTKEGQEDKTDNYTVDYEYGLLYVLPRSLIVMTASRDFGYDGTAHSYTDDATANHLVAGQKVVYDGKGTTEITDVIRDPNDRNVILGVKNVHGVVVITTDGSKTDKTHNYDITYEYGTLRVLPKEITITTGSAEFAYDGAEHWCTIADPTWLAEGHSISVTSYTKVIELGTFDNVLTVSIQDENGQNKDHNYNVTYSYGTLTVRPRKLVIVTGSDKKTYDGTPLTKDEYWLKGDREDCEDCEGFVLNHDFKDLVVNGSQTKVGWSYNTIAGETEDIVIVDTQGVDVSRYYTVTVEPGILEVIPRTLVIVTGSAQKTYDGEPLTENSYELEDGCDSFVLDHDFAGFVINGSQTEVGSSPNTIEESSEEILIVNGEGEDVSDCYTVSIKEGTLTVYPRPLVITTGSDEKVYDGTPLTNSEMNVQGLVPGEKIMDGLCPNGAQTDVGESYNTLNVETADIVITNKNGKNVASSYDIRVEVGTLKVTPREITITTASDSKEYDGTPLTNSKVTGNGLVLDHKVADSVKANGSQTDVGKSANTLGTKLEDVVIVDGEGNPVTKNYQITEVILGELEVTARFVIIVTNSDEKAYDGTPLTNSGVTAVSVTTGDNGFVLDHKVADHIKANGSQTDVGKSANTLETELEDIVIVDGKNKDVTSNYNIIEIVLGELEVTLRHLTIRTASDEKVYDGTPLENSAIFDEGDGLAEGHKFGVEVKANGSQTEIGQSDNTLNMDIADIIILDASGNPVTSNYELSLEMGVLSVVESEDDGDGDGGSGEGEGGGSGEGESGDGEGGSGDGEGGSGDGGSGEGEGGSGDGGSGEGEGGSGSGEGGSGGSGGSGSGGMVNLDGSLDGEMSEGDMGDMEGMGTILFSFTPDESGMYYFRIKSYGDYGFNSWDAAPTVYEVSGLEVNPLYFVALALQEAGYPISNIYIESQYEGLYWMLPYFGKDDGSGIVDDTMIAKDAWESYTLQMYVYEYLVGSGLTLQGTQYENLEEAYQAFVYQNYTSLPDDTKTAMNKVIAENGLDASSETIIEDVAKLVSGYVPYDLYTENYEGDYAEYFFEKAETAVCRHYATAATALYRTLGIPARYVVGYAGYGEAGEPSAVTAMQAHAWVEVYIDGLGWVPVEVTGAGGIPDGGGYPDEDETEKIALEIKPVNVLQKFDPENPTVYAKDELDPVTWQEYEDKGYTYTVDVEGSQTGVGFSYSHIVEGSFVMFDPDGVDVTDLFEITYQEGLITIYDEFLVEIIPINITYDGKEHFYTDYEAYMSWYRVTCPDGYEIILDGSALSMRDVGTMRMEEIQNAPCTVLFNGQVVEDFDLDNITFAGSPMTIKKRTIYVEAGSSTEVYESGKILTNETVTLKLGSLIAGHTLTAKTVGYLDRVGTTINRVGTVIIRDADGVDVTSCYNIVKESGKLTLIEDE